MCRNIAFLTISQKKKHFFLIFDKFWAFLNFFVKKNVKKVPPAVNSKSQKKRKKIKIQEHASLGNLVAKRNMRGFFDKISIN